MRPSGRALDELRAVSLELDVARHAEGSCLVKLRRHACPVRGDGRGAGAAVPAQHRQGLGHGRVRHAAALHQHPVPREAARGKQSGRTQEIQRLIGRSLRAVTRLDALGERQVILDCDVLQADGGTRTASITGAYVALHQRPGQAGRSRRSAQAAPCASPWPR